MARANISRILLPSIIMFMLVSGYVYLNRPTNVQSVQESPEIITPPVTDTEFLPETAPVEEVVEIHFAPLYPLKVGETVLQVSVARTNEERALGLSYTPYLPPGVGKLFTFERDNRWGIWMREMRYPIDILWLDAEGSIVHIAPAVSPDTYPQVFTPVTPSRYVLEVASGFAAEQGIGVGSSTAIQELLQILD